MKKNAFTLTMLLLVALVLIPASSAVGGTVFGPNQYVRTTGKPNVYTDTFSATAGEGMLTVRNGHWDGGKRVKDAITSASVSLNGEQVFGPSDFKKKVHLLEAPVNLLENNTITVELASKPGSYITVEVTQEGLPPTVTMTADPEEIRFGESSTLTWTSTDADSASIDHGVGDVP